jgi:hypothetical protein
MRPIAAKFVSKLLNSDEKEHRTAHYTELNEQAEKTVTLSPTSLLETNFGCLLYDAENKQPSSDSKLTATEESTTSEQCQINGDYYFFRH